MQDFNRTSADRSSIWSEPAGSQGLVCTTASVFRLLVAQIDEPYRVSGEASALAGTIVVRLYRRF